MKDDPNITPQVNLTAESAATQPSRPTVEFYTPPAPPMSIFDWIFWVEILFLLPALFVTIVLLCRGASAETYWWVLVSTPIGFYFLYRIIPARKKPTSIIRVGPEEIFYGKTGVRWENIRSIYVPANLAHVGVIERAKSKWKMEKQRLLPFMLPLAKEILARVQEGRMEIKVHRLEKAIARLEKIKRPTPLRYEYLACIGPAIFISMFLIFLHCTFSGGVLIALLFATMIIPGIPGELFGAKATMHHLAGQTKSTQQTILGLAIFPALVIVSINIVCNFVSPVVFFWTLATCLTAMLAYQMFTIRFGWSLISDAIAFIFFVAVGMTTWSITQQVFPQMNTIRLPDDSASISAINGIWHGNDRLAVTTIDYTWNGKWSIAVVDFRNNSWRQIAVPYVPLLTDFDGRYAVAICSVGDSRGLILIDLRDGYQETFIADGVGSPINAQSLLTTDSKAPKSAGQDDLLCWMERTKDADKIECKIFNLTTRTLEPCKISIPRKIDGYELENFCCGWIDSGRIGIVGLKNIGGEKETKHQPIVWMFNLADGKELSRYEGPICKQSRTSADFSGAFLEITSPSGESEIIYKNYIDGTQVKLTPGPIPRWMDDGVTGQRVIRGSDDKKQIWVFDSRSRSERRIMDLDSSEHPFCLSPDLRRCIVKKDINLIAPYRIKDSDGSETIIPSNYISSMFFSSMFSDNTSMPQSHWSPDSRRIVWFTGMWLEDKAKRRGDIILPSQCQTILVKD